MRNWNVGSSRFVASFKSGISFNLTPAFNSSFFHLRINFVEGTWIPNFPWIFSRRLATNSHPSKSI